MKGAVGVKWGSGKTARGGREFQVLARPPGAGTSLHGVAPQVPASLRLVESFLNSVDLESGRDDLDSLVRFRGWLVANGHRATAQSLTTDDLLFARKVRDALRDEVRGHGDTDRARLNELVAQVALRACFTPAGLWFEPAQDGVHGVLGEVLGAAVLADRAGHWQRLKICREPSCQLAFYDRSKNSSRCWCSMSACGNRNKTRAYRGRRRMARQRLAQPTFASQTGEMSQLARAAANVPGR